MAPRWIQVPHYYPLSLEETKSPVKALNLCHLRCQKNRLSQSCKEACDTDHAAVNLTPPSPSPVLTANKSRPWVSPRANISPPLSPVLTANKSRPGTSPRANVLSCNNNSYTSGGPPGILEGYNKKKIENVSKNAPTIQSDSQAHPVAFWTTFSILAILFSMVLLGIGIILFSNRVKVLQ